jgi:hypothetical protein
MALGDFTLMQTDNGFGAKGSRKCNVAASSTLINSGEPVAINALGDAVVIPLATNGPVVGTSFIVGIAVSTSTNTASAAGTVEVMPVDPSQIWLVAPKVAATFDTQSEYDALVGDRVLIDLTSSSYTALASDSANNGCVVQPLDISKVPGKVALSFRAGASNLA